MNNPKAVFKDYFLLLPSLIPLLLIFLFPLIVGVLLTFQTENSGFTLSNYLNFFSDSYYYTTIFKTFGVVIPAVAVESVMVLLVAYYLRKNFRGKGLINGLLIFPLTLGPLIIAVGMVGFFKPAGWLNQLLINIGLINEPLELLYNYWGVVIGLILLGIAFLYSNISSLVETIDPNLEFAARSLGAGDIKVFFSVYLPLIKSGFLTILALNLIMQLAVFSTAVLVGNPAGSTRVMTVAAFDEAMRYFNYNMASTIAFVMAITQIISVMIIFYIRNRGHIGSTSSFK